MKTPFATIASLLSVLGTLVACGGGGGGTGFSPPPPPGSGSDWQPGVFMDYNTFFARCTAPRSGINPYSGLPYPDIQGTVRDENNFLRSYSNDTYLWYDEIVDRDPGLYNDPLQYFDLLRTTATTPSGAPKDKFHFTVDTQTFNDEFVGGFVVGYGARFVLRSASPPREVVVAFTEPNSPATNLPQPLTRGASILAVDGIGIDEDFEAFLDGLFPPAPDNPGDPVEPHTLEVRDPGAASSRMVTMTPEVVEAAPVQNVKVINTGSGNVGYMQFNDHLATAEQALINAINTLRAGSGVSDLVIDIRYNGGGYLDIASSLAYMIAGPGPTAGQTFELIEFNNKHPVTNPVTGQAILPKPFHTATLGPPFNGNNGVAGQALPTLNLPRVFVLTGSGTCSASESIMNALRGVNVPVIQIGATTCGKPYGFYATDNCGTTYFTIQFRGVNDKGFGDYTDGFSPNNSPLPAGTLVSGCLVADDFGHALGDPAEARLSAALGYRDNGTCPPLPAQAGAETAGKPVGPEVPIDGRELNEPAWLKNRILLSQ